MAELTPFSIGEALDAYDAEWWRQREEEHEERARGPRRDALDEYTQLLAGGAHPPSECGDPASCRQHAEAWWAGYDAK